MAIKTVILTTLVTLLGNCLSSPVTPVFHAGAGRHIRPLHCVSKATQEAGVCMFAWNCLKANGTHLGTCIDRFYFGSCCLIKDQQSLVQETEKPVKTTEGEINHNSIEQNPAQVGVWPVDKFPTGAAVTSAKPVLGTINLGTTKVPISDDSNVAISEKPSAAVSGTLQTTTNASSSVSVTTTSPPVTSQQTVTTDKPSTLQELTSLKSVTTLPQISSTLEPIVNLSTRVPEPMSPESTTTNKPTATSTEPTSHATDAVTASVNMISTTVPAEIPPQSHPVPVVINVQSSVPVESVTSVTTLGSTVQPTNPPVTVASTSVEPIVATETVDIEDGDKTETDFANARPVHVNINVQSSLSTETTTSSPLGEEDSTVVDDLKPAAEPDELSTELIPSININVTDLDGEDETTIVPQTSSGSGDSVFITLTEVPEAVVTTILPQILSTLEPVLTGKPGVVSPTEDKVSQELPITKTEAPATSKQPIETTVKVSASDQSTTEAVTVVESVDTTLSDLMTTTAQPVTGAQNQTASTEGIRVSEVANRTEEVVVGNEPLLTPDETGSTSLNTSSSLAPDVSESGESSTQQAVVESSTSSAASPSSLSSTTLTETSSTTSTPVTSAAEVSTSPKTEQTSQASISSEAPLNAVTVNTTLSSTASKTEESSNVTVSIGSVETSTATEVTSTAQEVSSTSVAPAKEPEEPATTEPSETTTEAPSTVTATETTTKEPVSATKENPPSSVTSDKVTTTQATTSLAPAITTTQNPSAELTTIAKVTTTSALPTTTTSMTSTSPSTTSTTTAVPTSIPEDVVEPYDPEAYKKICGRPVLPAPRIVNGQTAYFGQWPWQISLRQWKTATFLHKCGAALLNENWAITAAHCVDNVQPEDILLRMGEYDLASENEPYNYTERRVQLVASHPKFDPRTFEYDLALLRFYEPVQFQPNIIPICIPEGEKDYVGSKGFVTGWGRLYEDGPLPSKLQQVEVPVISNSECEGMYRSAGYVEHIPKSIFICAGYKEGKRDSCEGDSGGPMVIREGGHWILGGVISWGIGCAEPNQPGVYTRITEFRNWINQIIVF